MLSLQSEITYIKGVGQKKAQILEKELQIRTVGDLLYHFPYKYIDRSRFYKIKELSAEQAYVQVRGQIRSFRIEGAGAAERLIAVLYDDTGSMELLWFKGIKWVQQNYKAGVDYIVFGKPTAFNGRINMAHPELEEIAHNAQNPQLGLEPHYNTTELMKKAFVTSRFLHKTIQTVLAELHAGAFVEPLPDDVRQRYKLLPLRDSMLHIHNPKDVELLKHARYRFKFEELFLIQLALLRQRHNRQVQAGSGHIFTRVGDYFNTFYHQHLPFELTNAQKRVIKEIRRDTAQGKQMNRLLQGDVGSGKTLVALLCMLIALDNGFQACLMAPTEILAQQHYNTISNFVKNMNVNVRLLTGSTKKKERNLINETLTNGETHILIGTHALIEDNVQFLNLGLVIIDEQHRFGVEQRAKMWNKNNIPPHILVMTATPIPRTLAMTVYGDLDVSVIDELPPGRKPIKTIHFFDSQRLRLFQFMREQIALGRQVYVVYPLIKESENMDYKDLEDGYESIARAFPPPQYVTCIVHGQMKAADKDANMKQFAEGKAHIMVATTVIEVGVNVPNASIMVVESAERFGLSQLHQLRGRVGRGAEQSFCVLMTSYKLSAEGRARINTLVNSNDGFEIAEADLRMRGPGDLDGTQQSGIPFNLKIANLAKDGEVLQQARDMATELLAADINLVLPQHANLKARMMRNHQQRGFTWSMIS